MKLIHRIVKKLKSRQDYITSHTFLLLLNKKDYNQLKDIDSVVCAGRIPIAILGMRIFCIKGIKSQVLYLGKGTNLNFSEDLK